MIIWWFIQNAFKMTPVSESIYSPPGVYSGNNGQNIINPVFEILIY